MSHMTVAEHKAHVRRARNLFLIVVSLYIAFELVRTGAIEAWLLTISLHVIPASFIAGAFFTSLFTVAPASVVIAEVGHLFSPWLVAAIGALGAVFGDMILFLFVRDSIAQRTTLFFTNAQRKHLKAFFRHPLLHWLLPALGALIILSPLPDEVGLAMLGLSRMDLKMFIAISYVMNFLGILGVAFVGSALF